MSNSTTEMNTYYAIECMNATNNTGWFLIGYGYDGFEKFNNFDEAKERIRNRKEMDKELGCKFNMKYRVVKITETTTKEVVE